VILWLFKEWFFALESRIGSKNPEENFTSIFNLEIKPFLQNLSAYAKVNPSYMEPVMIAKIDHYIGNPLDLFSALKESVRHEFFRTLYNDENYQLGYNLSYVNTVKNYLMNNSKTEYKFKEFNTFTEYLRVAEKEKQIKHGSKKETPLHSVEDLVKFIFHDTFYASYQREFNRLKQVPTGGKESGPMTGDDFSDANLVTQKRDSRSEAVLKIGPLYDCIRKMYGKIEEELKKEAADFKDEIDNILSNPSVIKNLPNMKKTLHKILVAKYISGKKPTDTDAAEGENYLTDMDFSDAQTPQYKDARSYTKNYLKTSLIKKEKIAECLENQKFQDAEFDKAMRNVIGFLYYVGLLNDLGNNPADPKKKKDVQPQEKRQMRSEFLSLLPDDLKDDITEEKLLEFSTMSLKQLPKVSYPVSMNDLRTNGFEKMYKEFMLSFEFPTPYSVYKKDKFGGVDRSATKEELMANFLEPIYEIIINKSIDLKRFYDEDEENFDCDKFIDYLKRIGTI
jgi:hypothetical protein